MEPCIPTDNSLANPSIYTTVLHTLTCILVPVNLFGAYCILFKTPKKMEAVKWLMLNLHFFSFFLDFSVSFLGIPYVLFPAVAGYGFGFWNFFRVQIYLMISSMDAVGVAILMLFENRFYALFGRNTWWEKVRIPYLIAANLLAPLFILPVMLVVPDQEAAYLEVSKKLPCTIPLVVQNRNLFVLATEILLPFICVASMTIWNFSQVAFFFFTIVIRMFQQNLKVTSSRTNDLQRKFLIALSLQSVLPFCVLLLPVAYMAYSVSLNYFNQVFNCLIVCMISAHGLLSTVIMISVHQPYRDFVIGPIYQLIGSQGTMIRRRGGAKVSVVQLSVVQ